MWTQLLVLILSALLVASINPNKNGEVAACRELQESLGPDALPKCHIMLAPIYFGYVTHVAAKIEINTVYGLGEDELVEWSGWMSLKWSDPRLAWNASNRSLGYMSIDRDSLWLPDIGFWNAKDDQLFDIRNKEFKSVEVSSGGTVELYTFIVVQSACALNIVMFPFDHQVCGIRIGTVLRNSFQFYNISVRCEASMPFYQVGEWDLRNISLNYQFINKTVDSVDVLFLLERRWMYYAVLVIVPYVLLTLLATIMFLVGDKSDPVGFSAGIIMSLTMYVMIASESSPKSMTVVPLLGWFLMIQMLILVVFTFLAAFDGKEQTASYELDSTLITKCKAAFFKYKNTICLFSYILLSLINALVFLYIWPFIINEHR